MVANLTRIVPRKLLDLPNETLDACMEELLPPLNDQIYESLPVPLDLCRLMAVCKTFRALALPWVWRRVQMYTREPPNAKNRRWASLYRQWTCLRDHPGLASHIRILHLSDCPSDSLAALHAVTYFMGNLRVLRFSLSHGPSSIIDQIYATLVTRPHLHTLFTSDYVYTNFHELHSFPNLKNLQISGWHGHVRLLEKAPYVESLAITGPCEYYPSGEDEPIPWTTMPIPWENIRELTIHDSYDFYLDDWFLILENFSSWKALTPNPSSPLTEVSIHITHSDLSVEQSRLLTVLGTQVQALSLGYLEKIDQSFLDHIVGGFPRLQELRILSQDMDAWKPALSTIAKSLGELSVLKRLHWSYLYENVDEGNNSEETDWESELRNILTVVVRHCHALELLVFHDDISQAWTSFNILRNCRGEYERYLENEGDENGPHFTSGWDLSKYSCI